MNRTAMLSSTLLLGILGSSAAGAAEGPYLGGAAQRSHFDSKDFSVDDIDKNDLGWQIIGGYHFTPNFSLEATYTDFGEANAPSAAAGGPFKADATAYSAFAVGSVPVGPVDLYAKAGAARIKAKGNVGAVFFRDKDTVFAYGGGVQLNMGNLGLRAEYQKFNTDVIGDLDVISLGLTYTFTPVPR